ncbi:DtxR family transcriptional regulator [bacterium]|nr:DtxR family transcriptional regulator [bacterium]
MSQPLINLIIFTLIVAVTWLGWRYGRHFLRLLRRNREFTARVLREDVLKFLVELGLNDSVAEERDVLRALQLEEQELRPVLSDLRQHGMLGEELELTEKGREYALRIMRAHRLYERYLADETGYEETEWHRRADEYEHRMTDSEVAGLARQLGNPTHDPHGDPIPAHDGYVAYYKNSMPLSELPAGREARIVHVEDEPEEAYAQLVAAGVASGQQLHLLRNSGGELTCACEGRELNLSSAVAGNVTVVPIEEKAEEQTHAATVDGRSLADLRPGEFATVLSLSKRIRGSERRRLLDLGLLPGTRVSAEMRSAGGDPVAYDIRGSLIALRRKLAELILVQAADGAADNAPPTILSTESHTEE